MKSRRAYIKAGGAAFLSSIPGCVSGLTSEGGSDTSTKRSSTATVEIPLSGEELDYPETCSTPRLTETKDRTTSADVEVRSDIFIINKTNNPTELKVAGIIDKEQVISRYYCLGADSPDDVIEESFPQFRGEGITFVFSTSGGLRATRFFSPSRPEQLSVSIKYQDMSFAVVT